MIALIVATCSSSPGPHYTTSLSAPSPLIINHLLISAGGEKSYSEKEKSVLLNNLSFPFSRFQTFEALYWTRIWDHNHRTRQRDQQPFVGNTREHVVRGLSPGANLGWQNRATIFHSLKPRCRTGKGQTTVWAQKPSRFWFVITNVGLDF